MPAWSTGCWARSVLLAALIVSGATPVVAADTTYDLTQGNGQYYRCVIDDRITTVRGIWWYFNGDGLDNRDWTAGADIQAMCAHWGFAAIATAGVGELYDNDPGSNDYLVQNALSSFASQSGHPELATMPWVLTGLSSGGYFACHEANQRPDRTIALIGFHGADLPADGLSTDELGIPCLIIAGDNDGVVPIGDLYDTFLNGIGQGADCAFAVDWGSPHIGQEYGTHLAAAWIDDAIRQRYPVARTGGMLLPMDPTQAYAADASWMGQTVIPATRVQPVPAGQFTGDPTTASWLPDAGTAAVYAAAASLVLPEGAEPFPGSPLHLDNPPQNPVTVAVLAGPSAQTTLTVDATQISGVQSVTLADGDVALGTVSAATATPLGQLWELTVTLAGGIHPITATAIDSSGGTWLTFATVVVDDGPPENAVLAPTVTMAAPLDGSAYLLPGPFPFQSAIIPGAQAVASVQYLVDGAAVATSTIAPFSASWAGAAPGPHVLTAIATDATGVAGESNPVEAVVYSALPAPWLHDDLGGVGAIGDAQSTDGQSFTVQASGTGFYDGSDDTGHWVWQDFSGDGAVVAQITAVPMMDPGGMAGISVRDGAMTAAADGEVGVDQVADGPFVGVMVYAGGVAELVSRATPDGAIVYTNAATVTVPVWTRLTRSGNVFTAALSNDGSTWTTLGSATVATPDGADAGLFAASNLDTTDTAQFAGVAVHPAAPLITSGESASAVVGTAFTYQIVASNDPTQYGATGLPSGLTLNPTTGAITGTPTTAGTATVMLSATNTGGIGQETLIVTVDPAGTVDVSPVVTAAGGGGGGGGGGGCGLGGAAATLLLIAGLGRASRRDRRRRDTPSRS